jgi:hypothetical protein
MKLMTKEFSIGMSNCYGEITVKETVKGRRFIVLGCEVSSGGVRLISKELYNLLEKELKEV